MFKLKIADPIPLCDVAGWDTGTPEQQKKWHQLRNHAAFDETDPHYVKYTVSGSIIAALYNVGFKILLELWHTKLGDYKEPAPDDEKQWIFDFGHLMEDVTAALFAKKTGYYVYNDTYIYQHGAYPWAVADKDRMYVRADGEEGVLELKTTSYENRKKWMDGNWPYNYELQLRFYMAVANVNHGALACCWGNGESDFAYYEFERDLELEEEIFEKAERFIQSLYDGIEPSIEDIPGTAAYDAVKRVYAKSSGESKMELSPEYANALAAYCSYQQKIDEQKKVIADLEKKQKELIADVLLAMKEAPAAYVQTEDTFFDISYKSAKPISRVSFKDVAKKRPDLAEALKDADLVSTTSARSFKVKKITVDENED